MDANKIIAGAADHDDRGYRPKQDYWHFPLLRFNGGTTRRITGRSCYRENVAMAEPPPALDHQAGAGGLAQSSLEIAVEGAQLVCRIFPPAEKAKEMRTGLPSGPEQSSTTPPAVGVISSSPNAVGEKAANRACQ